MPLSDMELYKLAMKELETPRKGVRESRTPSDMEQCLTPSNKHEFSKNDFGSFTCQKCGLIDEESTYFTPDFRYRERCTETRREYSYTRDKYFESMLNIFLCSKGPPKNIRAFAETLPRSITKLQIREEIRRQKRTGFSRYIRAIHLLATGGKPEHIHCTGIHESFYVQDSVLGKQCHHRKNSVNVWYKMYKLFQHNGVMVDVLDFPLPSHRKLEEYEIIMKKVWGKLHWKWVPLYFPPVE
jgi:hypothetical protein